MPRGTYLHLESGIEEHFQCAPGPAGWRYFSDSTDLTVDSRWRQIRVQLTADGWQIRGGLAGRDLLWVRNDQEFSADAYGFIADSPGFLVAVARSLKLTPGAHTDVRLVQISGGSLAARTITQRWALTSIDAHPTDLGALPVETYAVTDLETAESYEWHLAGDVVLAAPDIELTSLESPPSL